MRLVILALLLTATRLAAADHMSQTPTPAPSLGHDAGKRKANPVDGEEMVFVPAGWFTMGSDEWAKTGPVRRVYLDNFWIGRNDVTVAEFRSYCNATGYAYDWNSLAPKWGWHDDHPMVNVTWQEARSYCKWAGGDLPTEAQWEKAARGTDGRKYPWRTEFDTTKAWWGQDGTVGSAGRTRPVGSSPSVASPYGCLDMAGNAWQWCLDWYQDSYAGIPDRNPTGPDSGHDRVLRGGSWAISDPVYLRTDSRANSTPTLRYHFSGFRLCATALATKQAPTTDKARGARRTNPRDGQELVLVPAGWFTMGSEDWFDSKPVRRVYVDAFWIGENDVTVAQFRGYCKATGYDYHWNNLAPLRGWHGDNPMVMVTWDEAHAYCKWAGGDLPAEAQWEKAARGVDGRRYPWGNDFKRANGWFPSYGEKSPENLEDVKSYDPVRVGSFPAGASPYGCLDMAGNVDQWCLDWYQGSYTGLPDRNPTGAALGEWRVSRGGSYNDNTAETLRSYHRHEKSPRKRSNFIGFRLATAPL